MKIQFSDPKSPSFNNNKNKNPARPRFASAWEIHSPSLIPSIVRSKAWILGIVIIQFNHPLLIYLYFLKTNPLCTDLKRISRSPRKEIWGFLKIVKPIFLGVVQPSRVGQGWWKVGRRFGVSAALKHSSPLKPKRKKKDEIGYGARSPRRISRNRTIAEGQGSFTVSHCFDLLFVTYLKADGGRNYSTILLPILSIFHLNVYHLLFCLLWFQVCICFHLYLSNGWDGLDLITINLNSNSSLYVNLAACCLVWSQYSFVSQISLIVVMRSFKDSLYDRDGYISGYRKNSKVSKGKGSTNQGTPPMQKTTPKEGTNFPKASAAEEGKRSLKEEDFDEKLKLESLNIKDISLMCFVFGDPVDVGLIKTKLLVMDNFDFLKIGKQILRENTLDEQLGKIKMEILKIKNNSLLDAIFSNLVFNSSSFVTLCWKIISLLSIIFIFKFSIWSYQRSEDKHCIQYVDCTFVYNIYPIEMPWKNIWLINESYHELIWASNIYTPAPRKKVWISIESFHKLELFFNSNRSLKSLQLDVRSSTKIISIKRLLKGHPVKHRYNLGWKIYQKSHYNKYSNSFNVTSDCFLCKGINSYLLGWTGWNRLVHDQTSSKGHTTHGFIATVKTKSAEKTRKIKASKAESFMINKCFIVKFVTDALL